MNDRYRNHQIHLFLNDEELMLLEKKTELSGVKNKSDFIRRLIVYGAIFKVDLTFFNEFNTLLARIAKGINQMAVRVSGTGNLYEEDIKQLRRDMKEIFKIICAALEKVPSINP